MFLFNMMRFPENVTCAKARALRAAAQGPQFKRGPQSNVSVNKYFESPNSMETLYCLGKWIYQKLLGSSIC
jgi:hypothetical protein